MINFKEFFTFSNLFSPTTEPLKNGLYFFGVFGLALLTSLFLYLTFKRRQIKFQRVFQKRIADALFYLPTLMILYLFIRRGQIETASQPVILVSLIIIWLIWLLFLLYYRLAVTPKLYLEYGKKKREENYLRHGKSKK